MWVKRLSCAWIAAPEPSVFTTNQKEKVSMQYKQYQKFLSCLLVSSIGLMPLAACSKEPPKGKKDPYSYTLSIDAKGLPAVLDPKGIALPAERVEGPVNAKKIVRVRTFSVIDVEGSHFILIDIGGKVYKINLPD